MPIITIEEHEKEVRDVMFLTGTFVIAVGIAIGIYIGISISTKKVAKTEAELVSCYKNYLQKTKQLESELRNRRSGYAR